MKLQHMAVIFVIIFLPIILVTAYFISLQVDTIKLQESYDKKLLDATHDAMSAFELNTANEDLSSVADSLRSIIEASNNIFFNTLTTNFGVSNASKSYIQPFIPAILYTLYDGFYVYSPTNTPEVCTDLKGQTISTDSKGVTFERTINFNGKEIGVYKFNQDALVYDENGTTESQYAIGFTESNASVNYNTLPNTVKQEYGQLLYKNNDGTYSTVLHTSGNYATSTAYKQSYILKSFISYATTYSKNNEYNVTVNYTLDNFITIQGDIKGVYYSKSGYFISSKLINKITVDGVDIGVSDWTRYSEESWLATINNPENHEVKVTLCNGTSPDGSLSYTTISNRDGAYLEYGVTKYWEDSMSSVEYYIKAWLFSSWIREYLSDVCATNIANNDYEIFNNGETAIRANINSDKTNLQDDMFHRFNNDVGVFPFRERDDYLNDPENKESPFALHKRNVIKNSISYNLSLSMIVYTEWNKITEFNMPVLSDVEWERIMSNVSIVTFMQGLKCGLKYYNNYAIVSSTNNEITVTPNEIYYTPRELGFNTESSGSTILASLDYDETQLNHGAHISTAHRIDCPELPSIPENPLPYIADLTYISFKSKEVKYDKVYDKENARYVYDHQVYTDYTCIVDSNYVVDSNGEKIDGNTNVLKYLIDGRSSNS